MSDDTAADILKSVQTSDRVRAAAWDAFYQATSADELAARLKDMPLPQETKAALWDAKQAKPATFSTTNEKDAAGEAVVDPNTVGTFARHYGAQVNPLPLGQVLPFPQALGGGGMLAPIKAGANLLKAQGQLFDRAKQAYEQGDYVSAAAHALHWLLPVIGPVLDQAGTELRQGKVAASAGDTLGVATSLFGAKPIAEAVATKSAKIGPVIQTTLTPEEQAANRFAQAQDIPLDAATATGSKFARGTQKVAGESLAGSFAAERARAAQDAALARTGESLAAQVHPEAVTAEQAGEGVRGGVQKLVGDLNAQASTAYDKLRAIEENPNLSELTQTAPEGSAAAQSILGKLAAGSESGTAPSKAELMVMRQIEVELESQPFTPRLLKKWRYGSDLEHVEGTGGAGAQVYHDILQAAPGTSSMTRGEVLNGLRKTLETGEWNNASRGAWDVAKQRLSNGSERLTGPNLPSNTPMVGRLERVNLPVDLRSSKQALRPLYDRLKRESELIPLQGDKGRALVALDRLINGPDSAPLSTVDAALGDLKAMARADIPELRTQGQGLAAAAVKQLDQVVQNTARRAGPAAIDALEEGRGATRAKYQVADTLESLRPESVQVFRQLTAKGDAAIGQLRAVADAAPLEVPKIGRAYLQQLLDTATERGRFEHADKLYAEWQKLGPATKRILFPEAGQVSALNDFFLLAKRINENPNPSGTAATLLKGGEGVGLLTHPLITLPGTISAGVLAKVLYSPAAIRLLTKQYRIGLNALRAGDAARLASTGAKIRGMLPGLIRTAGATEQASEESTPTGPPAAAAGIP